MKDKWGNASQVNDIREYPSAAARPAFPKGGGEEAASPQKKESQPRLAALGSPFQRKGLAWILPPSAGRRCPEGAEARSCYQLKKNVRYAFPRIVIPSAAEGSFSFPVSLSLRNAVCMKHRDPTSHGVRCFPLSAVLTFPDRSRMKKISRFRSK